MLANGAFGNTGGGGGTGVWQSHDWWSTLAAASTDIATQAIVKQNARVRVTRGAGALARICRMRRGSELPGIAIPTKWIRAPDCPMERASSRRYPEYSRGS